MADLVDYSGSLVAFEGPADIISTQLRLLPTSPHLLILPSIQNYLLSSSAEYEFQDFSAPSYIRKVHDAAVLRHETALSFLREPISGSKRLVFMNGGTPSAYALCIRTIAKHETDGNLDLAESRFGHLVRRGLQDIDTDESSLGNRLGLGSPYDELEDPIARAMKAADALDRLTAALQPNAMDQMTPRIRPRSLSLPLYGYADHFGDAVPFYVFGAASQGKEDESQKEDEFGIDWRRLRRPDMAIRSHSDEAIADSDACPQPDLDKMEGKSLGVGLGTLSRMPSCIGETYNQARERPTSFLSSLGSEPTASPLSDVFHMPTVNRIICGKASLVDLPPMRPTRIKRALSLDRVMPNSPTFKDLCSVANREGLGAIVKLADDKLSYATWNNKKGTLPNQPNLPDSSNIAPPPPPPPKSKRRPARLTYVDRGSDADDRSKQHVCFQPVLPFVEDLVVYFKHDSPDQLLQNVVKSFKAGSYPATEPSTGSSDAGEHLDVPHTPMSLTPTGRYSISAVHRGDDAKAAGSFNLDAGEYDPFAYHQSPALVSKPSKPSQQSNSSSTVPILGVALLRPPTPARTPPPTLSDGGEKFHDFNTSEYPTAIKTQNALRSVLNIYFPAGPDDNGSGYHQFMFPLLLPELGGLWAPIFCEAEPEPLRSRASLRKPKKQHRHVDMILAVGSQGCVKRDFLAGIVAQLEKLGTKPTGATRSGRLDFRYLMANAMQAFTQLPLANQAHDNPFTNPYHLATLIVPCLETYLAAHAQVRFLLLEYPSEHLSTILALQRLVGVDVLKVAQVVEPKNSKQPLPFNHLRGGSIGGSARADGSASSMSGLTLGTASSSSPSTMLGSTHGRPLPAMPTSPPPENLTISTANYLLTATASESEISTFISTIWKILMDISSFYIPDGKPTKATPSLFYSVSMGDMRSSSSFARPSPLPPTMMTTAAKRTKSGSGGRPKPLLPSMFSPFPRVSSNPYSPPVSPKAARFPSTSSATAALANVTAAAAAAAAVFEDHALPHSSTGPIRKQPSMATLSAPPPPMPIPPRAGSLMDDTLTIRSGKSGKYHHHHHHNAGDFYYNSSSYRPPSSSTYRPDTSRRPYTVSTFGDTDSEWDVDLSREERRLMPMFMKKGPPKGNSQKALRFLGLA